MYLKCPKCKNVWSVSKLKDDKEDKGECCPLHENVRGVKITKDARKEIVSTYGLAVGGIEGRAHGYYNGSCGGKVLVPKGD